ncbi:MAG: ECF-type riboflavin transporter substrate-binding protein [Ruminococcaceae bacterium]|nr:ECF-type riboflavin transporter substrate-binding protein [Oscillospiraceae bacterium]
MDTKLSVKTVVAIGIGAALFFVCGRFIAIPSPVPNTSVTIQYGVLAFMAAVFGPIAGALIGLIGHALIDASWGWGIWWSWVIASAVFGGLMGFATRKMPLADGVCGSDELIRFNVTQVICHVICWGAVAPVLDILIYNEPVEKLFVQGLFSGIANAVTTAVIGSLLCVAYAKARPQKGSLEQED